MKNLTVRPIAMVALLAMLGLGIPTLATAETTTTTVATTTTTVPATTTTVVGSTTTTTVPATCRQELTKWIRQYSTWHEARSDIYGRYSKAYNNALNRLALAIVRDRSQSDVKAALAKFNTAVATAKATRDAALTKLGAAPTEPTC
jgi:hypothetical protein